MVVGTDTDAILTAPWQSDVTAAAIEEWKADTTAFDRLTTVVDTTIEPAFAREIAERAAVAEPTARRHLNSLPEVGRVATVSADGGIKYNVSRMRDLEENLDVAAIDHHSSGIRRANGRLDYRSHRGHHLSIGVLSSRTFLSPTP